MKYILLFTALLCPFYALSQANYHKGSITITNDKVLIGYIDYHEWTINPESIHFKTSLDDKKSDIYYPASIQSFTVDGLDGYLSYKGSISMNKTNFPDLPVAKDTSSKEASFFLRMIVKGNNVALLSYTDGLKTRFFIQEKSEQPYELGFQRYYAGSNTDIKLDNRYLGQLADLIARYAQSNVGMLEKVQTTAYTEDDIEGIVNMINGTTKANRAKRTTDNGLSSLRFFAGAGFSVASSTFHREPNFENGSGTTTTPQVNFGLDIFTNPVVQKFLFRLEAGLSYINPVIKNQQALTTLSLLPYTLTSTYTYNQYNLRITPQFIYNLYNANSLKVYIDAGLIVNVSKYTNQSYVTFTTLSADYRITPATVNYPPYKLEDTWISYSFQSGVVFNKRIELFLNYMIPSSYLTYQGGYSLQTAYYNAGVHYFFGHH
ncbi:hypothetical protein BDD43_1693 [Mucilaginibacter gracilis]|uniref:Outer membrane protein with beta-barrel domain n=1 Tax=Mucilaginibacter gracilis TaxID=423350 RepID=A0A495IXW4_9SPHI|nr:hypothetical protein [Mucilaginibacter gracilis]RKR81546.1 hypothetical protein BDD43_1693 [Mucilaginibacter gracilis]